MDDRELLARYARDGDETAFTQLVHTHVDFVYAAALRQLGGDRHLAADVAQEVFTDLARKAAMLVNHPVLKGWLFTSARFVAAKIVRRDQRRRAREQLAEILPETADAALNSIKPVLDETLAELKPAERDAVLLRFFEGQGYAQIAARLAISEDGARRRVDRALLRMRSRLARHGIASTAAALGATLTSQAAIAAPAGLATSIAHTALSYAATAPALGALQTIMGTKTTLGAVAILAAATLLTAPIVVVAVHETRAAAAAEAQIRHARVARATLVHERAAVPEPTGHDPVRAPAAQAQSAREHATSPKVATAPSATGPSAPTQRGDGAAFLTAYPQIRPLLLEAGKLRTDPQLLAILAKAGMSPDQVDAFNTRMWNERIESLKATPDLGLGWTVGGLPSPDELRPIIGDAGIAAITAWTQRAEVNSAAASVAANVALDGTPLTPEQVEQLTQAMYTVKPSATLAPGSPDWNAAFGALQAQLTPAQWRLVENGVAQVGFPRLLDFLQRQPGQDNSAKTNPAPATP